MPLVHFEVKIQKEQTKNIYKSISRTLRTVVDFSHSFSANSSFKKL